MNIQNSEDGIILPSPPKPLRPHLSVSRRGSTGNIVRQKLVESVNDSKRARSGPSRRSSSRDNTVENRAKSGPATGRHSSDISPDNLNAREDDTVTLEAKKLVRSYKEHVRPILKEMDSNVQQDDARTLCENCQRLLVMLKKVGILPESKAVEISCFKGQILKCLFGCLGVKDPRLHLRLAKIVLMVGCFR